VVAEAEHQLGDGHRARGGGRVLILDANQRSALAATRSLGRRGIHVITADQTSRTLAGASRYCRATLTYPSPSSSPDAFVAALRAAVAAQTIDLLLPMSEVTTEMILTRGGELGGVSIPFGTLDAFERLNDKRRLSEIAAELGIRVPRTFSVDSPATLQAAVDAMTFPVAAKPYRSRIPTANGWVPGEVRYARSAEELLALARDEMPFRAHPFLVQEYIAGSGQGVFALYDRGQAMIFFAHRRVRERPPSGGVSVVSESVPMDPYLQGIARRILDHVGWHGVAMVEFKVTAEGKPYLMEVNPRFWGSLQLAIDAGVDFPWLVYQLSMRELGQSAQAIAPTQYQVGVRARWLLGDLDHLYLRLRDERGVKARWQALRAFFRPLGKGTRHEVNRWDDWRPFATELRQYFAGPGR
jgi:predicted ATP-grasp superfamily ATP-dependent carboligase